VSNRVSHSCLAVALHINYLQPGLINEYKPWLLARYENMLIIVYQRHSNVNALILDTSSQDLVLRGSSFGNKISILHSRNLLSSIHVPFKPKSLTESQPDQIHKRRWHAPNTRNRYRSIHKKNFPKDHDEGGRQIDG